MKYFAAKGDYWDNYIGVPGEWVEVSVWRYIWLKIRKFKTYKNFQPQPNINDEIKITYLDPCINGGGDPNPYIGMAGKVTWIDKQTNAFELHTGKSILMVTRGKYKYEKTNRHS